MPRAMTKADYDNLGTNHARNAGGPTMFSRDSKSWQARAYWAAYDEEIARRPVVAPAQVAKDWISAEKLKAALDATVPASSFDRTMSGGANIQNMPRIRPTHTITRHHPRLGLMVSTIGPLYPPRIKGRSRRGWTAVPTAVEAVQPAA